MPMTMMTMTTTHSLVERGRVTVREAQRRGCGGWRVSSECQVTDLRGRGESEGLFGRAPAWTAGVELNVIDSQATDLTHIR